MPYARHLPPLLLRTAVTDLPVLAMVDILPVCYKRSESWERQLPPVLEAAKSKLKGWMKTDINGESKTQTTVIENRWMMQVFETQITTQLHR